MAKINRFTRLSPSRFTPRSVEEIMMVPLAKQQQHNIAEAKLDELESFNYNRLTGDEEISAQELADYRSKVGEAVDSLATSGVSNVNRSRVLDLNRELKKNMSSEGKWGRRKANFDAYKAWTEEMKKKDNRGDWSPRAVQTFMGQQSAGFKTENEDGTFNTFKGGYLPDYIDVQEKIDTLLKNVPATVQEQLTDKGLVRNGRINLTDIYTKRTVKGRDKGLIFNYLRSALGNDKKLLESVMMENKLDGFREKDPLAMNGEFVKVKDKVTGVETEQFKPSSSLEAKIYASTMAAAGITDIDTKYLSVKDEVALATMKESIKKQFASKDSGIVKIDGTLLQGISQEEYSKLNYEIGNLETAQKQTNVQLSKIKDKYTENSPEYRAAFKEAQVQGNELSNLKTRVEDANSRGAEMLSDKDKILYQTAKTYDTLVQGPSGIMLDENAQRINLIEEIGGSDLAIKASLENTPLEELKKQFFEKEGIDVDETTSYEFNPYGARGDTGISENNLTKSNAYRGDIDKKIREIKDQVHSNAQEIITEDYKSGVGATMYQVISSDDAKLFNQSLYQMLSGLEGDNFDINSYASSESGLPLSKVYEGEFGKGEDQIDLTKTKVKLATSTTANGNGQFVVQFHNSDGMQLPDKQVRSTMGSDGSHYFSNVGKSLIESYDYTTKEIGEKLLYNGMSGITKSAGMQESGLLKSGKISRYSLYTDEKGKDIIPTWSKTKLPGGKYDYRVNLDGKRESTRIKNIDDMNAYLYLSGLLTSGAAPKWSKIAFIQRFGEEEYETFTEE